MAAIGSNGLPAPKVSQEVAGLDRATGLLQPISVDASGFVNVNATVTPAPGGATAANQVLEINQLTTLNGKTAAGLVPEHYDYQDITYVGATTDIDQVVYKLGGSAGAVVATLTLGYDGSNRLISVTKT